MTRETLHKRLQHAERVHEDAAQYLADLERQPAPSRYDLIIARRDAERALSAREDVENELYHLQTRTA